MEPIKKILRTPSAFVLLLIAVVSLIGVVIKSETDQAIARIPIDATSTAEARLTEFANVSSTSQIAFVTETLNPFFTNPTPSETNIVISSTPAPTSTNIPPTPSPYIKGYETFGAYPASPISTPHVSLKDGELLVGTAVRFAAKAYGCNTIDTKVNIPYTVFLIRGPIELDIEIDNGGWDKWVNEFVYDNNVAESLLQPKRDEIMKHENYPLVGLVECIIPPTSSTNHYFQAGLADYQSQRYDDAITNLNSCVQFNPSFSDCYNILGMAYRQKNDYGQAILNHDKAIALDPRYDYYFERGVTYHQKSVFTKPAEYDKAISDFKSCLELNPTFSNCLTRLGMVYRDSGDLAQALIYHNKAIELSPERADFYWERGITYQKMGDTEKANADFQKARDLGYGN